MTTYAYSKALALESASGLPYNQQTGEYILPSDMLESYARIIAYKVAYNIRLGYPMNQDIDPLTYVDCGVEE
jgi:hypothetical protein